MSLYTIQIIWTIICILGYSYIIYKVGYWTYKKAFDEIIQETLDDCTSAIPDYELSNEGGDKINQGWIEATEYLKNQTPKWKLPQIDDDFIDELKMEFDTYEDLTKRNKKGDDK